MASPKWKGEKYEATLHETGNNGTGCRAYGNTMDEARKKLYKEFENTRWHKGASSPVGFLYELNSKGQVKGSIAYFTFDKRERFITQRSYKSNSVRIVKKDGKLGMTMQMFYHKKNKLMGL